jgi:hypothetical protein
VHRTYFSAPAPPSACVIFLDAPPLYFGTTFSVQFRPSPDARFVVVQSDPNMVGTVMSAFETNIVSSTVGTYTPAGGYSSSLYVFRL